MIASKLSAAVSPPLVLAPEPSMYVAQPSFSQMSDQRSGLTAFPNHWCAISWTTVPSRATRE